VKDDLQKFHERNMRDERYAISRQLLDLGEAVTRLREEAGMTRGELARKLRVKASDIAIIEEETPQAAAGLLEATLRMLVSHFAANMQRHSQVSVSVERIRQLRPGLLSVMPA